MKLNCDMGESFGSWSMGNDEEVMPFIDMANIACGFHASDPLIMDKTVKLAVAQGVSIGAHPGYPDLVGFGRRNIAVSAKEVEGLIAYQVGALQAICQVNDTQIDYVKPHGALYNTMMRDNDTLQAILKTMHAYQPGLPLVVQALPDNSREQQMAEQYGVPLLLEAFSDRVYDDEGYLVPRSQPDAVLQTKVQIEQQIVSIMEHGYVTSASGKQVNINADTLCVHGDNENAVFAVRRVKSGLGQVGYANKVYF